VKEIPNILSGAIVALKEPTTYPIASIANSAVF